METTAEASVGGFTEVETNVWELPRSGAMRVPGRIYASRALLDANRREGPRPAGERRLPSRYRRRGLRDAGRALGLRISDRRRRGVRSRTGRDHFGRRRGIRHFLRRANVPHGTPGFGSRGAARDGRARSLPHRPGRHRIGGRHPPRRRRARADAARRRALGGRERMGRGVGPLACRGARVHVGRGPPGREPARPGPAASRDGDARFRQSLSRAPGRRQDLRRGRRGGIRRGERGSPGEIHCGSRGLGHQIGTEFMRTWRRPGRGTGS